MLTQKEEKTECHTSPTGGLCWSAPLPETEGLSQATLDIMAEQKHSLVPVTWQDEHTDVTGVP